MVASCDAMALPPLGGWRVTGLELDGRSVAPDGRVRLSDRDCGIVDCGSGDGKDGDRKPYPIERLGTRPSCQTGKRPLQLSEGSAAGKRGIGTAVTASTDAGVCLARFIRRLRRETS